MIRPHRTPYFPEQTSPFHSVRPLCLVQNDQIFDADRRSVPEHRLGVLKRRIGDYCRGERRQLPPKIDAAAAVAAVDEIRRHYLPARALQNDRDITAATAGVPQECRQPVTFRRYER